MILLRDLVGQKHLRTIFDAVSKTPELTKAEQKAFGRKRQRAPDKRLSLLRASQLRALVKKLGPWGKNIQKKFEIFTDFKHILNMFKYHFFPSQ